MDIIKRWMHSYRITNNKDPNSPYLMRQISPTTISPTRHSKNSPSRITEMRWSDSILSCSPRNCRSFCQSLPAVTRTTTRTATRMATPSIQPASPSVSSPPTFPPLSARHKGGNSINNLQQMGVLRFLYRLAKAHRLCNWMLWDTIEYWFIIALSSRA